MDYKLIIAGLGPGPREYLTLGSFDIIKNSKKVLARTEKHDTVKFLKDKNINVETLDFMYSESEDFNVLNSKIAEYILGLIKKYNEVVYCVPGNGINFDASVMETVKLCRNENIEVSVCPGISQEDMASQALKPHMTGRYTFMCASDYTDFRPDPRMSLFITELDSRILSSELKLKLLEHYPDNLNITVIYVNEKQKTCIKDIELYMLDRLDHYDQTMTVYIPPVDIMSLNNFDFTHLNQIMGILRGEGGCPWDREQTHESLKQYLIEETYEVIEAINMKSPEKMIEELGDVLFQVVFHAKIAEEHGEFNIDDITTSICRKMIDRHTHIFGNDKAETSDEVLKNWEAIKKKEKGFKSYTQVLKDIPPILPALMRSYKVQQKASNVGFDWDNAEDAFQKVYEEIDELKYEISCNDKKLIENELGDLIFSIVNVARFYKIQPEIALNGTTEKFINRFKFMEQSANERGQDLKKMTIDQMNELWNESKKGEDSAH